MKILEHVFVERNAGFLYHVVEKEGEPDTIILHMATEDEYNAIHIELTRKEAQQLYRRLGYILKKQSNAGDEKL